ncbi:hypothetical protein AN218_29280, partial [Streptomyces nanshensis]
MRKTIRRSLLVAAAASGVWALSTAGASAAELPVGSDAGSTAHGAVEHVEKAGHAGESAAGTVRGTDAGDTVRHLTGTVGDTLRGVQQKLPSKGIPENGLPTNTLPTGGLSTGDLPTEGLPSGAQDRVAGTLHGTDGLDGVEDARGTAGRVADRAGHPGKAVNEAREDVRSAVPGELPV